MELAVQKYFKHKTWPKLCISHFICLYTTEELTRLYKLQQYMIH